MSGIQTLSVRTNTREELVNITGDVARLVSDSGVTSGVATVYCPHTTGAITIQEAADPDVARDLVAILRQLIPRSGDYRHAEGNSDAHAKSSLVGSSEVIFIEDGVLLLGTWQGIFFCEFDGPRTRKVHVKIIAD